MQLVDPVITAYALAMAGVLGLVMGSFVNCWAWRFLRGESVLSGRSHCTACGHDLGARDLVPVLSWLASGGACRYCGQKVSARYPITELVCAGVFVAVTARYGLTLQALELLAFCCVLLFLSLTDLDDYIIPNGCILVALAIRVAYLAAECALGASGLSDVLYYVGSALGVGVALVAVVLAADRLFGRDSMGGGDLKLYAVAALYFGWQQGLFLVIVSCIIGIVVAAASSASLARGGRRTEGDEPGAPEGLDSSGGSAGPDEPNSPHGGGFMKRVIPFGPSIAAACVVTMLAGDAVISWYLAFL